MDLCNQLYNCIVPQNKPVFREAVPYGAVSLALTAGAGYLFMVASTTASAPLLVAACAVSFLAVSIFAGALGCGLKSQTVDEFQRDIRPAILTTFTGLCVDAGRQFVHVVIHEFAKAAVDAVLGRDPRHRR